MGRIQIEKLNPHPKNEYYFTDIIGEKYEEIKRSIDTYGIRDPLKVTTAYTIISGHQRYRIARDLGLSEVPVEIVDVDEWKAEYMLIAENVERRGEAELDPIKKGRIAQFLKEYWDVKSGGRGSNQHVQVGQNADLRSMKDVSETIGEDERTTRRLIKLNDLIPQLQTLVSTGKLGTTAAEQLAYLTVEEQSTLFELKGETIADMSVGEVKKLRKEIEDLREENKKLLTENVELKNKVNTLESQPAKVITNTIQETPEHVKQELVSLKTKVGKLKEIEEERDRYLSQAKLLEEEINNLKTDEKPFSPQTNMFLKRRGKIQELCYELIDQIKFIVVAPPLDMPEMYLADTTVLFEDVIYKVTEAMESLKGNKKINYVDAEYTAI